ncbi:hypothetical protein SIID45300_01862 [Candidatus Magnetaquicoccaceae bacterium FCR-1]|uniref:Uncharacterized protein n=1 Tax=Candidatus Magnetaquiglobus chichijimensis TaxID=3141448 RepID=A0ABQ0C9H0_9PROT
MTQTGTNANPEQTTGGNRVGKETDEALPPGLKRPLRDAMTRLLSGRPMDEEILDPANPNLILDRER